MIAWLNPGAWVGLAVLAGPVLVHLLLRHRAARILFPSLRFVRASRTAAVRLRPPSDLLLLALRLATLGLAVVALAQPLLLAPARVAAWNARLARAVVVDVSDSMKPLMASAARAARRRSAIHDGQVPHRGSGSGDGVPQGRRRLATGPTRAARDRRHFGLSIWRASRVQTSTLCRSRRAFDSFR